MEQFNYDFNLTHEVNFEIWRRISDKERVAYKEKPYSDTEARKIFNMYFITKTRW